MRKTIWRTETDFHLDFVVRISIICNIPSRPASVLKEISLSNNDGCNDQHSLDVEMYATFHF